MDPIVGAAISAAVIFTVNVFINLLRKGEPRLIQSVVSGVLAGIIITAIRYYWANAKKTNSGTSDSL